MCGDMASRNEVIMGSDGTFAQHDDSGTTPVIEHAPTRYHEREHALLILIRKSGAVFRGRFNKVNSLTRFYGTRRCTGILLSTHVA